jgi:hypothetical protein
MLELVARIGFAWVKWQSRQGLRDSGEATAQAKKREALQIGVRGERMLTGTCGASAIFLSRETTCLRVLKANLT